MMAGTAWRLMSSWLVEEKALGSIPVLVDFSVVDNE